MINKHRDCAIRSNNKCEQKNVLVKFLWQLIIQCIARGGIFFRSDIGQKIDRKENTLAN